jgi:uncharacterized protein (TIGR02271 family)
MVGMDETTNLSPDHTPEVLLSEERLRAGTRTVERGRVRVAKRVVVEERTVTVQVRREELVVEHLPAGAGSPAERRAGVPGEPVLELTLAEEEVEVVTRAVPRERVRVYVDTLESTESLAASVAHEEATVETYPLAAGTTAARP